MWFNSYTFSGIVQVRVDSWASNNVFHVENHRPDVLLTNLSRIFGVDKVGNVKHQLKLRGKDSKNSFINIPINRLNLELKLLNLKCQKQIFCYDGSSSVTNIVELR